MPFTDLWDDWKGVQGVADAKVTALEAGFVNVVGKVGGAELRTGVEGAIKQGNAPKVFDLVADSWGTKANDQRAVITEIITETVVDSGKLSAEKILDDPSAVQFDVTNPQASLYARDKVGTLIDQIGEDQLKTIRQAVKDAMDSGLSSRKVANRVFESVGLQSRQYMALQNYRADLGGKGLTSARIEKLVKRKEKLYRGLRAEAIARTESMRAANMGQLLLWEEGIKQGQLDPSRLVKKWIVTPDDRLCDRCLALGKKPIPMGQGFANGVPAPPLHPLCRCAIGLVRASKSSPVQRVGPIGEPPLASSRAIGVKKKRPAGRRPTKRKIPDNLEKTAGKPVPRTPQGTSLEPTWDRHVIGKDKDGNPIFTPERQKLHDEILEHQLAGPRDKAGNLIRRATAVEKPEIAVLGGGPASGKTVANKAALKRFGNNAAPVDPDEIRGMFPEYQVLVVEGSSEAASITHVEASHLAKRIIKEGQRRGLNIVADGTGDGDYDSFVRKLAGYRKRGATRLVGNYVTIDTDEAMIRMLGRAERSGRYVPEDVLRGTHRGVSRVVPRAIDDDLFDEFALWDNNSPADVPPKLIARWKRGGELEIVDGPAYRRFLAKADETVGDSYPKPLRQSRTTAIANSGDRNISDLDGKVTSRKELDVMSSSETMIVQGKDFKGVFKPTEGEGFAGMRSTVTNQDFNLARRETLAYRIDRLLGTNMVPDTKVRTVRRTKGWLGGPGSIQRFVTDAKTAGKSGFRPGSMIRTGRRVRGERPRTSIRIYMDKEKIDAGDLQRQLILDLVIGNTDRHSSNYMLKVIDGRKRIVSIDHGLSFPQSGHSRRYRRYRGTKIEDILIDDTFGMMEFRSDSVEFLAQVVGPGKDIDKRLAGQVLENMARLDIDDLVEEFGVGMNASEVAALKARFKWVERHLKRGDLLQELVKSGYHGDAGWQKLPLGASKVSS